MKLERARRERDAVTFGTMQFKKFGARSQAWRDLNRLALSLRWWQFFIGLFATLITSIPDAC